MASVAQARKEGEEGNRDPIAGDASARSPRGKKARKRCGLVAAPPSSVPLFGSPHAIHFNRCHPPPSSRDPTWADAVAAGPSCLLFCLLGDSWRSSGNLWICARHAIPPQPGCARTHVHDSDLQLVTFLPASGDFAGLQNPGVYEHVTRRVTYVTGASGWKMEAIDYASTREAKPQAAPARLGRLVWRTCDQDR
ncbi:hypothetical protein PYCCODRAFT_7380 [Trametes coccinea BRFM310]|uniref:Uncharacterized protein n=1 Tax=Trametes coccinea (strain BRFM310) TaxID=1353009 RepID=A0A1Y2J4G8_TRAC3|nr:hypothetical protein PYCCODRAFT_7380 [Trametes coccinea BRFM310]